MKLFRKYLVLFILIGLGILGNAFGAQVFFDTYYFFGSIFVFIILSMYKLPIGIISAIVIYSPLFLSGKSFDLVFIFLFESIFVAYQIYKRKKDVFSMVLLFRGLLIIPQIIIFFFMDRDITLTFIFVYVVLQSMNSIGNAILANLLVSLFQHKERRSNMTFDEYLFQRLIGIFLIPIIIILFFITHLEGIKVKDEIQTDFSTIANELWITYDVWERSNINILTSLSNQISEDGVENLEHLNDDLKLLYNSSDYFSKLYIADKHATILASYPDEQDDSIIGKNYSYRYYYQKMIRTKTSVISNVIESSDASNEPTVMISIPIIKNNDFLGYIAASIDVKLIGELIDVLGPSNEFNISILDSSYQIIASNNKSEEYIGRIDTIRNGIDFSTITLDDNLNMQDNQLRLNQLNNIMIFYEDILSTDQWRIAVSAPATYYFKSVLNRYLIMLMFAFLSILFIGIMAKFMIRRNMKPIHTLSEISSSMSEKIYNNEKIMWPKGTALEVQNLITNFSTVANELSDSMQTIKENNIKFELIAHYDELTGLPNKHYLEKEFEDKLKQHKFKQYAFIKIDIDNFNNINNFLGYSNGDELLIEVGNRLVNSFASSKFVFKESEDEYIIMTEYASKEDLERKINKIKRIINERYNIAQMSFHCTFSIGVSHYPKNGSDLDTLLMAADTALYEAKNSGKNSTVFYDVDMREKVRKKVEIEEKLRVALSNSDELFVVYQPIVSAENQTVVGSEALIRWRHPVDGMVFPDQFIPVAESSGLIMQLGTYVLKTACEDTVRLNRKYNEKRTIAVNISITQLYDHDFIPNLERVLRSSGLQPELLYLEITENVASENMGLINKIFNNIRALGVKLAIDDFGVAYSSLNYLKTFNVDKIKIDKLFIDTINENAFDATLVQSVIALGHSVDYKIVAEGVEEAQQYKKLIGLHCDEIQGYLFSKPLELDQYEQYIIKPKKIDIL